MMNKAALLLIFLTAAAAISAEAAFRPAVQQPGGAELHSIPPPDDPEIDRYIDEYLSEHGRKTMNAILKRAAPYLGFIYDRLIERNMPPELMYLPAVESGFRPWAVSRSGAAGLWQFMMNSISPFDIEVDQWRDDRRDFWRATEAALEKLQYNYDKLGSWPLAVAAYNCGLGRVQRAVAASGTSDYIELYKRGYLPKETRQYVPKLFAFAHLCFYYSSYGLPAPAETATDSSGRWAKVELNQAVSLRLLSAEADIPHRLLREANAELRHDISPPAGSGYFLKVPVEYSDNVERVLSESTQPLLRFYIHKIGRGDTFYALARHFGVSVSMIEQYNPSSDPRSLRAGEKIVIPALKECGPYRNGSDTEPEQWAGAGSYTVRSGDTLWSIAKTYGTSAEEIAFNNGISADGILRAGAVIQVPEAD